MNSPETTSSTTSTERRQKLAGSVEDWLAFVGAQGGEVGTLLGSPATEQDRLGFRHTLREIVQQPLTWLETTAHLERRVGVFEGELARLRTGPFGSILLTGSGSSVYAGECLAPALQTALGLPVQAVSAGNLLTHPQASLPPSGASLLVSFARSGNSPESCGVLDTVREIAPAIRHMVITCNGAGRLATSSAGDARVATVVLDDKTELRVTAPPGRNIAPGQAVWLHLPAEQCRALAEE